MPSERCLVRKNPDTTNKMRKQLERIRDENPDDLVKYKDQADIPSGRVGYTAEVLFDGEKVYVDYSDPGFAIAVAFSIASFCNSGKP